MEHILDLWTWQAPWPSDPDLYFSSSDFDTIYVDVPDLLKYKAYNHQTLHSAPRSTDSAGILTRWPWPIFRARVTLTHLMSMFHISSTIRPTTTKPCIVLLYVRTRQVPWLGDLDLYFVLQWLWHIWRQLSVSPQIEDLQQPNLAYCFSSMYWLGGFFDPVTLTYICAAVTLTHFTSTFDISSTIRPSTIKHCLVSLLILLT